MSYEAERKLNERYGEIPFDSERKLMSTCHVLKRENAELFEDTQKVMITKGAVDVLLGRVAYIKTRDGVRKITQSDREAIEACNSEFSRNGLRVLAFAYKAAENGTMPGVDDENALVFLGLISMMDPPR